MNDLQKLLSLRAISAKQIADATGENYHSVQKTIKGQRSPAHIQAAIARYLRMEEPQLFGPGSARTLKPLIAQELEKLTEREWDRLRCSIRSRRSSKGRVAKGRKVGNG